MSKKEIKKQLWNKMPNYWKLAVINCRCKTRFLNNVCEDVSNENNKTFAKIEYIIESHTHGSFCLLFSFENSKEGFDYWNSINKWVNYYNNQINS